MHIENYRNLTDVEMTFHEKANYLVGENAIGKSGFLRLLSVMSEGFGIREDDYADRWKCTCFGTKTSILPRFPMSGGRR